MGLILGGLGSDGVCEVPGEVQGGYPTSNGV